MVTDPRLGTAASSAPVSAGGASGDTGLAWNSITSSEYSRCSLSATSPCSNCARSASVMVAGRSGTSPRLGYGASEPAADPPSPPPEAHPPATASATASARAVAKMLIDWLRRPSLGIDFPYSLAAGPRHAPICDFNIARWWLRGYKRFHGPARGSSHLSHISLSARDVFLAKADFAPRDHKGLSHGRSTRHTTADA